MVQAERRGPAGRRRRQARRVLPGVPARAVPPRAPDGDAAGRPSSRRPARRPLRRGPRGQPSSATARPWPTCRRRSTTTASRATARSTTRSSATTSSARSGWPRTSSPFEDDPRIYGDYLTESVYLLLTQSTLPKDDEPQERAGADGRDPAGRRRRPGRRSGKPAAGEGRDGHPPDRRGDRLLHRRAVHAGRRARRRGRARRERRRGDRRGARGATWRSSRTRSCPGRPTPGGSARSSSRGSSSWSSTPGSRPTRCSPRPRREADRVEREMAVIARQLWGTTFPGEPLPPDDADGRREMIRRVLDAVGRRPRHARDARRRRPRDRRRDQGRSSPTTTDPHACPSPTSAGSSRCPSSCGATRSPT